MSFVTRHARSGSFVKAANECIPRAKLFSWNMTTSDTDAHCALFVIAGWEHDPNTYGFIMAWRLANCIEKSKAVAFVSRKARGLQRQH
jgi:hypothetical protein